MSQVQARVRDTPHFHWWESHKNTKLHNHNVYAEDEPAFLGGQSTVQVKKKKTAHAAEQDTQGKEGQGEKRGLAPSVVKKQEAIKVVNPLFEKRPKNFWGGHSVQKRSHMLCQMTPLH